VSGRAEDTVRMLSRIIEQTGDSVFVTDRQGTIQYVNPSFEALTGFSRQEAIGATPRLFKSDEHDTRFFQDLWRRLMSGHTVRTVFTNRRKDGHLYHEDQTITPIRDGAGEIRHFVSTGRDITERRRAEEALRRLNDRLEHEANRIAGVLHDEAGQFLTAAHITLAAVGRTLPPAARERLREVQQHLDQVEEHLRRMSHELRPRILDDLGLADAVAFLANGVSGRSGVAVDVDVELERPCPPLIATAVYRMVQEALTNVTRHARARRATVVLRRDEAGLLCSVRDDGVGFDAAAPGAEAGDRGLGIVGIRDRLAAFGATLSITSAPGSGTELRTVIPLETSDAPPHSPGR
jgi:two-component system, NarL family, sensor histidine kinase NreB